MLLVLTVTRLQCMESMWHCWCCAEAFEFLNVRPCTSRTTRVRVCESKAYTGKVQKNRGITQGYVCTLCVDVYTPYTPLHSAMFCLLRCRLVARAVMG